MVYACKGLKIRKKRRLWKGKAILSLVSVFLILTLTGCEGSNDLTLKDTAETQQTEHISDPEIENETEDETEVLDLDNGDLVYQVTTINSNLNVRENPEDESNIIGSLSNEELVTGTGETLGNWMQVKYFLNS